MAAPKDRLQGIVSSADDVDSIFPHVIHDEWWIEASTLTERGGDTFDATETADQMLAVYVHM